MLPLTLRRFVVTLAGTVLLASRPALADQPIARYPVLTAGYFGGLGVGTFGLAGRHGAQGDLWLDPRVPWIGVGGRYSAASETGAFDSREWTAAEVSLAAALLDARGDAKFFLAAGFGRARSREERLLGSLRDGETVVVRRTESLVSLSLGGSAHPHLVRPLALSAFVRWEQGIESSHASFTVNAGVGFAIRDTRSERRR